MVDTVSADSVKESNVFPVNSNGEILLQSGTGDNVVAGYIPSGSIPKHTTTDKMVVKLPDELAAPKVARRQFRFRPVGKIVTSTSGHVTRHATYTLPTDFVAWKVRCYNNAAVSIPNHLAAVAPSANATVPYVPTGSWTTALFNGTALHTIPAATVSDANNFVPGQIESDVMFLPSVPRTDSGSGTIIMLRNVVPFGAPANNPRLDAHATPLFPANGLAAYNHAGVDGITDPTVFHDPVLPSGGLTFPPVEFIGYTLANVRRVHLIGSSTFAGQGDATAGRHGLGWVEDTKNILNAGTPSKVYSFSVGSQPGCTTNWTTKKIVGDLALDGIDACIFATYSANDTDRATQAGMDRVIAQTVYFIDECRRNGIVPILSTSQAITGDTGTFNDNRRLVNARVRAIAAQYNLQVIDFELWLSTMTGAGAWINPDFEDDTLHPNSAGHAYVGTKAAPVIAAALPY